MIQYCPFCGLEVAEGAAYCESCGKKLPDTPTVICKKCGHQCTPGDSFCRECGSSFEESDLFSYCPECGEPNHKSFDFCIYCGCLLHEDTVFSGSNNMSGNFSRKGYFSKDRRQARARRRSAILAAKSLKAPDNLPYKSRMVTLFLCLFFGMLGFHYMYLGYLGKGRAYLLCNLLLWWTAIVPVIIFLLCIIDFFVITCRSTTDAYNRLLY